MKTWALFFVLMFGVSAQAENIPGPFWYSLSEKILAETQQLFGSDSQKSTAKAKVKKVKLQATPLKCEPKKCNIEPVPFPAPVKKQTTESEQQA